MFFVICNLIELVQGNFVVFLCPDVYRLVVVKPIGVVLFLFWLMIDNSLGLVTRLDHFMVNLFFVTTVNEANLIRSNKKSN
jgi:hypothetical protein